MEELVGNKVKRYLILTCNNCHESSEIDFKDFVEVADIKSDRTAAIICPWCGQPISMVTSYNSISGLRCAERIVRVD